MSGLALTQLSLSHFRSHKSCTIKTDARPIAIYGPNGAGKTNILEAVSMLSPGRGLRRAKPEELPKQPEGLGWRVRAEITSLGRDHEVETGVEGSGSRSVIIDGKTAPQLSLGRLARIVWLVPVMDRLWVEAAEGRRRFLDRIAMSLEPKHGEAVIAYEKSMRERNRMLKDGVMDPGWYGAVEAQLAARGAEITSNRLAAIDRISAAQEEASDAFPTAELELIGKDGSTVLDQESDLKLALEEGRSRDAVAGRTLSGPHRDDLAAVYSAKGQAARLCSTGEQKALLISLVLANGRALAQDFGAAPIYLLDEVAAHLDAERRASLYAEIEKLGAQAWLTGTGADLFEELDNSAQRLEVTESTEGSRIREI